MSGGAALGGDIVTGGETLEDVDLGGDREAEGCCGLITSEGATPEIVFPVCLAETGLTIGRVFGFG